MSTVQLKNIVKRYSTTQVIHGIDLFIEDGDFCVLVGPSGCGKSTLLRMIAGLEQVTEGDIFVGDSPITHTPAAERGVAMVFQSYALYPHMTVAENIGFGLKMTGVKKDIVRQKVQQVADIVQLSDYMDRYPKALSGGQRQRVAIGRAIVRNPNVFLFDEPLSNLDAELRVEMRVELAKLHKQLQTTMIYVTHDQVEAMTLADKIVVLNNGHIEQVGTPMALYEDPQNKFVARFIGSPTMNFFDATVQADGIYIQDIADTPIPPATLNDCPQAGTALQAGIRPQALSAIKHTDGYTVELVEKLGDIAYIHVAIDTSKKIMVAADNNTDITVADKVTIDFDPKHMYFFDSATEKRIR